MGCCTSREAGGDVAHRPDDPQTVEASRSGRAARETSSNPTTTASSVRAPPFAQGTAFTSHSTSQDPTPRTSTGNHTAPTDANTGTPGRPNKPLRAPSPVRSSPKDRRTGTVIPWTHSHLQREREAFFHTRVSGDPEAWSALRLMCEMLREGNTAGAQGILDATGLNCPTGRVKIDRSATGHKGGVYDARGVRYEVPGWVVVDPDDVVEDPEMEKDFGVDGVEDDDGEEDEDGKEVGRRRGDEKGKGKVEDVGEMITVTARLSDRGRDVSVQVGEQQKVRVLVRRILEKLTMESKTKIRIAYMGRMLAEDKSLAEQGYKEGHVLNAMVFEG